MNDQLIYHTIDFLLPAQEFNVNFSYVSQKGLSFIREYILRLVNISPMSKLQIATYFGLSKAEIDEAINDLIDRDELTLNEHDRLVLTENSRNYFYDISSEMNLTTIAESMVKINFDLATFSYFKPDFNLHSKTQWELGLRLEAPKEHFAFSAEHAKEQFTRNFFNLLDDEYLAPHLLHEKQRPHLYMVSSVVPLYKRPLRLKVEFKVDRFGEPIVRDAFEGLSESDSIHALITEHLSKGIKSYNGHEILESMQYLDDHSTKKLLNSNLELKDIQIIQNKSDTEINDGEKRIPFIGPLYQRNNWEKIAKKIDQITRKISKSKADNGGLKLSWIAPSDPFWGKSEFIGDVLGYILRSSQNKGKVLLQPDFYLPIADKYDRKSSKRWKQSFPQYLENIIGIREGFLKGNVEIFHIEEELAVVSYHISNRDILPVTMPIGFMTTNLKEVNFIGEILKEYINGYTGHDQPNNCGSIKGIS
ncbi:MULTISPECIES: hypothetical protein [Acinetobacter]|uniref:hypothetical protein n=1 Tax=Acinetobacter TaxID=469 RepID=UPI000A330A16|nr:MULTISPECIES: hypothetical protein [Acinetobacter]EJB8374420.1 hypothetical protein [Acinetobacter baumannii]MCT9498435.1 hypothetical protein [Acinetobacter baumannii]MDH2577738.1 hypothetical protein [Acinetobacter baumannii]OTM18368.1 hypothetical protein B9X54_04790 [Acinetobacter baumannii]